jgi:hypothetical protein
LKKRDRKADKVSINGYVLNTDDKQMIEKVLERRPKLFSLKCKMEYKKNKEKGQQEDYKGERNVN